MAWAGECPMERRIQYLPSVARFRLMRPPATLSRVVTQDWLAGCAHESARSSYFRRKYARLSALQQVYGHQHNHCNMFLYLHNLMSGPDADARWHALDLFYMTASGPPPNQLLQMLDAADFDLLRPHLVTIELVRETVLSSADVALQHVYFPHDAIVSITVGLSEGPTIEVAMLGRDSIVGGGAALADGIAASDAVVLFPGTASAVEIPAFRNVAAASVEFRRLVIRHEQALLARAQQSLLCNTLHPVEARLARWLLRARELSDRETLPLTQETLAQMMGVRRNAVSLVAHALQRAGIIRYSRGQIEITDLHALEATSCDCYSATKAYHARLLGRLDAGNNSARSIPECTQGGIEQTKGRADP